MWEDLFQVMKNRRTAEKVATEAGQDKKVSVPKDLMIKCPRCNKTQFQDDFIQNGKVCPECGYHARLTARERIAMTVDKGSFVEYDAGMVSQNPIDFPGYTLKLRVLQQKTGLKEAVVTGECTIRKRPCVIVVMDSHFMMASMGSVVGEKITRAFERATEQGLPIIIFAASGGARMQEGIVSLMQMAKTSAAAALHAEAGYLYITVLTDPTTGGVTASFASLGDIIVAEPKVLVGFAGRRVIEGTIRQKLPDEFQTAEFLLEHGFIDMIVPRSEMRRTLSRLMKLHGVAAIQKKEGAE